MFKRPSLAADEQGDYQSVPIRATPMAARITQAAIRDHRDQDLARWSRL
jgi:hypothetical protein